MTRNSDIMSSTPVTQLESDSLPSDEVLSVVQLAAQRLIANPQDAAVVAYMLHARTLCVHIETRMAALIGKLREPDYDGHPFWGPRASLGQIEPTGAMALMVQGETPTALFTPLGCLSLEVPAKWDSVAGSDHWQQFKTEFGLELVEDTDHTELDANFHLYQITRHTLPNGPKLSSAAQVKARHRRNFLSDSEVSRIRIMCDQCWLMLHPPKKVLVYQ